MKQLYYQSNKDQFCPFNYLFHNSKVIIVVHVANYYHVINQQVT